MPEDPNSPRNMPRNMLEAEIDKLREFRTRMEGAPQRIIEKILALDDVSVDPVIGTQIVYAINEGEFNEAIYGAGGLP